MPKNGYKARGRGALGKEKPPIFGMIQRSGEVFIQMLPNVKQITIKPINESVIIRGIKVYTENIDIYCRLSEWGYEYKTVNHGADEFARDGDGFHEVHINYGGRILVPSAFMVTAASRNFTGETC